VIELGADGALIYMIGGPNRYSKMMDEEFREDAKRGSILGSAVIGLEHSLHRREAEYMIEAKLRIDKNATPVAGEPPEDTPQLKRSSLHVAANPSRAASAACARLLLSGFASMASLRRK